MHPRLFAESQPNHPALIMDATGETISYAQLEARANQAAQLFRAEGLVTGDSVAIFMVNEAAYFEVVWGAQRAGLSYTPISSMLNAAEAEYIVRDCGAKALIVSRMLVEQAASLTDRLNDLTSLKRFATGPLQGYAEWSQIRAAQPAFPIADESAGYPMFYSSGTTGRPKGVRQPQISEPVTAPHPFGEFARGVYGFGPDTVYLSPAPLYFSAPTSWCMFVQRCGGTAVVMDRFSPEAALQAIERHRVTHSQWSPTMFTRMLKLPETVRRAYRVSSQRVAIHAAAPCPIAVKQQMIAWWGPVIYEYYGGTEGAGVTLINSEEALARPGSVGRSIWGPIHIVGEDGCEQPTGAPGIVYFEGGSAFTYHGDAEKTAGSRHRDHPNWSTLGDIGYLDVDGYLYLTDRKDFMIVSGGVNVYPQEVENLLVTHPKVGDVAVFGVPDDDLGEAVKAVVEPLDWADATADLGVELMAFCREHLAGPKRPKSIDFERSLPRHETGKLYKRLLRDHYWVGRKTRIA